MLFAQDTYIVPKADGRIIVGATVEPGKFDGDVTPSGMMHCLSEATRLIPGLGDLPIEESWAGLRPTTPDKCPILGKTPQWENVYLAGGYWRNGVLLAPKTGQLVGDLIMNGGDLDQLSEEDQTLLKAFSWERFTIPGGGKALAANARYAATFYPVHKRSTSGVSTSVGTELGFYEGAAAATDDRAKDRKSMFGLAEEEEAALERAAGMGRDDAQAFSFGNEADGWMVNKIGDNADVLDDSDEDDASIEGFAVEADPDAYTVAVLGDDANKDEPAPPLMLQEERSNEKVDIKGDLPSLYEKIKANKAKGGSKEMGENPDRERPDPGFRIHFVDPKTRELTEVPPYTSPGEFHQMKAEGKLTSSGTATGGGQRVEGNADTSATSIPDSTEEEGKPLFDGYQTIREAYGGGTTDEETAEYTRQARMKNRGKSSEIDESKIGATRLEDNSSVPLSSPSPPTTVSTASAEDLSSVNNQVQSDKAQIDDGSDEKTFDGYQEIMNANSSTSREDELQRMKEARMRNRVKASQLDDLFQ